MSRPGVEQIPAALREVAVEIASRLQAAGHRAWIVGGAVRDLALGQPPLDLDMASAATPEEIERLFERTIGVGRAFGTVIVHLRGVDVELTTYRAELGYSDGRRPDSVRFGTTLEEDSARRDFTCNALYLDPLRDEIADPRGGLEDVRARRLRCIGDPSERFREDALRLARMARLAGALGVEVDPATLEAARREAPGLARVSVERRLGELTRAFEKPGSAEAARLLFGTGLMRFLVPGQDALRPPGCPAERADALRLAALRALAEGPQGEPDIAGPGAPVGVSAATRAARAGRQPPGIAAGLAVLLDPAPEGGAEAEGGLAQAEVVLDALRPSRHVRARVLALLRMERQAEELIARGMGSRAQRLRLLRDPLWPQTERLLRAWRRARGKPEADVDALASLLAAVPAPERFPAPLITSGDLARAGLPPGRSWALLLEEAETAQLDLALTDREQALRWLAERVAQLGGNT